MYCKVAIEENAMIMGKNVALSTDIGIDVERSGQAMVNSDVGSTSFKVSITGNTTGIEYVFETSAGTFADGGCGSKRSALSGDILTLTAEDMSAGASPTVKVSWGACGGEPPYPCQIYLNTKSVSLTTAVPSKTMMV